MSAQRLGVYVHVPFCLRKCDYCSFVSYAGILSPELAASYVSAVLDELASKPLLKTEGFTGWTLFIGGGTPTTLGAELERLLDGIIGMMAGSGWGEPLEATVEANPGTVSHKSAARIVRAGANRFSIGVQSLVDSELKAIGRIHSAEDAERAFDACRYAGAKSVSVDIIAGLPGQDAGSLLATLEGLAALLPDHVSCYGLTLEEGTPLFGYVSEGLVQVPGDDEICTLLDMAADWLTSMGLNRYEISNYSKPGHESLHNLLYWSDMPYIGLGASAHSYAPYEMSRSWNVTDIGGYINAVSSGSSPMGGHEALTLERAMSDALILSLRTAKGASVKQIEARYNAKFPADSMNALAWARANELLSVGTDGRVILTKRGFMLSNALFSKLV